MNTETEIKLKVDDLDAVRPRLRDAGATSKGTRSELNAFFDTPDRSLRAKGSGLRVRTMTDASGTRTSVVTLKGKATGDAVRSREEIEFAIGDPDAAALLLERLGYRPTIGFEKRRETWSLADCLVELDTLPHLGTFVEVEGPSEASVTAVQRTIGLLDVPPESRGYISMIDALIQRDRSLGPVVRFSR